MKVFTFGQKAEILKKIHSFVMTFEIYWFILVWGAIRNVAKEWCHSQWCQESFQVRVGGPFGWPGIEPWSTACKTSALSTLLSADPLLEINFALFGGGYLLLKKSWKIIFQNLSSRKNFICTCVYVCTQILCTRSWEHMCSGIYSVTLSVVTGFWASGLVGNNEKNVRNLDRLLHGPYWLSLIDSLPYHTN